MAHHGFPQFSDGNVEIQFSETDEKYVLHNYVLALHSSWFKASLSDRWNANGQDSLANGKHHWTYELRFDKGANMGMLVRKATPSDPSPTDTEFVLGSKGQLPSGTDEAGVKLEKERIAVLKAHQDMLCCLYHVAPAFSHSSFDSAKSSILYLCQVAEMYGCEAVAKLHVESHLRLYHREVLDLCCNDPVAMLELATVVKSAWIFMEASTHLLGRSKRFYDKSKAKLAELGIADLLDRKRATFGRQLKECESNMFQIEARHENDDGWAHAALGFFREWLSEELRSDRGSRLGPGYARLYHTIAKGKFAFKVPSQQRQVQVYIDKLLGPGYEIKSQHELERELTHIFSEAAKIIEHVLEDHTRRQDTKQDVHRALLFMRIEDDELPWLKK